MTTTDALVLPLSATLLHCELRVSLLLFQLALSTKCICWQPGKLSWFHVWDKFNK